MKVLIPFAAAVVLVTGCSSNSVQQDDPIVEKLKGQPVNYAEKKLGLPNKRSETRSGAMVWVYLDKKKGIGANDCTVTLSIRNDVIENVAVDTDRHSLFSLISSSCERIRKYLEIES